MSEDPPEKLPREQCPYCTSEDRGRRKVIDEGDGPMWCDHGWHDGDDVARV